MEKDVVYKLYLGYDEETIDMFSSLCQMEARRDGVPIDPRLRRLLQDEQPDQFLFEDRASLEDQERHKVITIKDKNQITVKGREFTKGLANAVVIAYIYDVDDDESQAKPHIFAYAPVSFEKAFSTEHVIKRFKMVYIILVLAIVVACSVFVVFAAFHCVKKRAT